MFCGIRLFSILIAACTSHEAPDKPDDTAPVADDTAPVVDDTAPIPVDPHANPGERGPYLVGNTSVFYTDDTRTLACADGSRVLLTEFWYPADDSASTLPENGTLDFFLGRWDEVVAALGGKGDEMLDLPTGSHRDAPVHPGTDGFPVVVFSHGFLSNRFQNFTMAGQLASHGYVVVAPDHTCNSQVALTEDGVAVATDTNPLAALDDRVADVGFIMDRLEADPPAILAGRLDLERIALWGHSYGGVTAFETIKVDRRVRAILPMAAFGFAPLPKDLDLATMGLSGQEDSVMAPFESWYDKVMAQVPTPRFDLEFVDTGHFAFSDLCRFVPALATENGCGTNTRLDGKGTFDNPDPDVMQGALGSLAVAFFGATFFGEESCVDFLSANPFPDLVGEYAAEGFVGD